MPRKRFEEEHENHERWLVSYADFITLLFAFFVVMYAISSVNEGKYRVLANALGSAFGHSDQAILPPVMPKSMPTPNQLLPRTSSKQRATEAALRKERDKLTTMASDIADALAPLVKQGKVRVTQTDRGVSVEINASVLFAPGDAKLSSESEQALTAVARILKDDNHAIQVEGHTDNTPISNTRYPSNWELSAVRAGSVVRLFADNGVAESRMEAIGHGSTQPIDSNDTADGRMRNRRVGVMILSELPSQVTEVPLRGDKAESGKEKPVSADDQTAGSRPAH